MAAVLYANNATSLLASGISDSDLSLTLQTGDGSKFPNPTAPDYFYLTLTDDVTNEIVKVTARSGDVLTIVRGQDGTTAASWALNTKAQLRVTKGMLDDILKWDFKTDSNPYFQVPTVTGIVATPSETGGSIGAGTYYYTVIASRGLLNTAKSAEASATIAGSTGSIALTWDHSGGATFYTIYRSTVSGTIVTPAFIGQTSSNSYTDILTTPSSGSFTLTATNQWLAPGAAYISDLFDNSGSTFNYSSVFIDSIAAQSANATAASTALVLTSQTPASNTYNQGIRNGLVLRVNQAGSGTNTGANGITCQVIQSGSGSSLGSLLGGNFLAQYIGQNTAQLGTSYGALGQLTNSSNGKITTMYGLNGSVNISGTGAKADTMYGVYGIATQSSTASSAITNGLYGVYGQANVTTAGVSSPRTQGGYFQVSVGNSSGTACTSTTARGVEGWMYQTTTGVSTNVSGGHFTSSSYGTVSNEMNGVVGTTENYSSSPVPYTYAGQFRANIYGTSSSSIENVATLASSVNYGSGSANAITGVRGGGSNQGGGTATYVYGGDFTSYSSSGSSTLIVGIGASTTLAGTASTADHQGGYAYAFNSGTGNITYANGFIAKHENYSTGNISIQSAISGGVKNTGNGAITKQVGIELYAESSGGTGAITTQIGGALTAFNSGMANIATQYGTQSQSINNGQAITTTAYGAYSSVQNTSTGTITTAYGMYTEVLKPAGTLTTAYGLYIGTIQGTNKWSLYQSDSNATNYFAGKMQIPNLTNAADDSAAATAGIAVGQLYRNGSIVMIRVS